MNDDVPWDVMACGWMTVADWNDDDRCVCGWD